MFVIFCICQYIGLSNGTFEDMKVNPQNGHMRSCKCPDCVLSDQREKETCPLTQNQNLRESERGCNSEPMI